MEPTHDRPEPISWQLLKAARKRVAARFPSPFRLPLAKRPSDLLYGRLRDGQRVLDVGSGDATRRERIAARFPSVVYVSVDPDPEAGADHPSLDGAGDGFDVAIAFEVLEHLAPGDGLALLRGLHARVREGGIVLLSVPCTHTPGRYLRDATHVTPWAHDELGGALELAGFEVVSLHRTFPGTAFGRALRRAVLGPIGHLFGLDYAHSVVAVGRR